MVSFLKAYKWVPVALVFIVLVGFFAPRVLPSLENQLSSAPDQGSGSPPTPASIIAQGQSIKTVLDVCFNTPPRFSPKMAHQAAVSIANMIDSAIAPGFGGLLFYSQYISSHSYGDEAVNFKVSPLVPVLPSPTPPRYTNNPVTDAPIKQDYEATVTAWQGAVNNQQSQVDAFRSQVKRNTDRLRALKFYFNNSADDLAGCFGEASEHFKAAPFASVKELLLVSDLFSTSSAQDLGSSFTLSGVNVAVAYNDCNGSPAFCQARSDYWKQLVKKAGGKSFVSYDVGQSEVSLPVSL